jgi:hypothetical protein
MATAWATHRPTVVVAQSSHIREDADPFGIPGSLVILEPEKLTGKPFLFASHINLGSQLHNGMDHFTGALRLRRMRCPCRCWRLASGPQPPAFSESSTQPATGSPQRRSPYCWTTASSVLPSMADNPVCRSLTGTGGQNHQFAIIGQLLPPAGDVRG